MPETYDFYVTCKCGARLHVFAERTPGAPDFDPSTFFHCEKGDEFTTHGDIIRIEERSAGASREVKPYRLCPRPKSH